ncbi:MAG: hemolysin-type calcium-binding protein, partial [Planctomycetaceae bacterium]|nr:hemolysin-type calcium-binding protein [Planctomycetaceae bacterium]
MLLINNLLNLFARSNHKTPAKRKAKQPVTALQTEALEQRQVLSVDSVFFSGATLVFHTDNNSTSLEVRTVGSNVQVNELNSGRVWNYAASSVGTVEFQGGNGNDRLVSYSQYLPIRAFGGYGNDYLESYDGNDVLVGGGGDDTLSGYGGNDQLWGGDGNDLLLGGNGNDDLMGEYGNDQLNGQAGTDRLWGSYGDDVLIAIDNGTTDYLQSDDGYDTLWVDQTGSTKDAMYANSTYDKVQAVTGF